MLENQGRRAHSPDVFSSGEMSDETECAVFNEETEGESTEYKIIRKQRESFTEFNVRA